MSGRRPPASRPTLGSQPLAGIDLVLVDGNNLLHRIAGGPDRQATHLLLGRLRAALPPGVDGIVVLDGPPDPGAPFRERLRPGLEIRHAGRQDADTVIVGLVRARPQLRRGATVAVTDDRGLTERVRAAGGLTRRLDWLVALFGREAAPTSIGAATPPDQAETAGRGPRTAPREPWRPGRGATRKRGPGRRAPRRRD